MGGSIVNTVRLPDPPLDYTQAYFQQFNGILNKWMVQLQSQSNFETSLTAIETTTSTSVIVSLSGGTYLVDTTAGNTTVTLPSASTVTGRKFIIKRVSAGANSLTVQATAGNIDGASTYSMATQYMARELQSDGTNYFIVSAYITGWGY